jgi:Cystathionine beta-lyases/cystathionine gamma-synthases
VKFATRLIHPGSETDPVTGAASVPIYLASTYHHASLDEPPAFDYARSGNPTRAALEEAAARLEGGAAAFAFSSGMAAIASVLMLFSTGDHLVVSEDVYGGTYRLLTTVLARLGIETTFVDTTDPERVAAAVRPNTKALYIETPSNPTLKITDLRAMVAIAQRHGLLTIVDNTFLTPYRQRPLELGCDIVVHSATKFLSGHSDVVAGLAIVRDAELGRRLYAVQNAVGAVLGVQDSWLLLRGLKTLKVRLDQAERTAAQLAAWLKTHPAVRRVYYPGLRDHPGHATHRSQATGDGAVLAFDLGSAEAVRRFVQAVRLPIVAVSLGAVESILTYPARMSHAAMPPEVRRARGIGDGLLRLSVGLEALEDLQADLAQALAAAGAALPQR